MTAPLNMNPAPLADFCRRWKIAQLSLFGSVLTDDFRPDSDVDVLVDFEEGVVWDFDEWEEMRSELHGHFGRPVDLVERRWIRNPFMRHSILSTKRTIYAA